MIETILFVIVGFFAFTGAAFWFVFWGIKTGRMENVSLFGLRIEP